MITVMQLSDNIRNYITSQLTLMSKNTPIVGLMKPIIVRVMDKNFSKVTDMLNLIADEEGNIDIEGVLTEMMNNIVDANPFVIKTSFIGDIKIGNGTIKLNIPFTDKELVLNSEDLNTLKEALITKS